MKTHLIYDERVLMGGALDVAISETALYIYNKEKSERSKFFGAPSSDRQESLKAIYQKYLFQGIFESSLAPKGESFKTLTSKIEEDHLKHFSSLLAKNYPSESRPHIHKMINQNHDVTLLTILPLYLFLVAYNVDKHSTFLEFIRTDRLTVLTPAEYAKRDQSLKYLIDSLVDCAKKEINKHERTIFTSLSLESIKEISLSLGKNADKKRIVLCSQTRPGEEFPPYYYVPNLSKLEDVVEALEADNVIDILGK
ncbi:MAG TPA: hypothetical protein VJJ23_03870 [Candidatus Nanoarchaeia archaeon]|nr:hypothetical protein [Candidatus Nanoarchaeia archaeon]